MDQNESSDRIAACSKVIFNWCRARVTTREDAEDLSQDILLELWKSADSLRSEEAFYGFMWAVAGNVFRKWLRRKAKRGGLESPEEGIEDMPDGGDLSDALVQAEADGDLLLLRRELGLLDEKYRRVALLYYRENLACAEIARVLGTSEGMVKYLLFKARNKLKEGMVMERKLGTLSYNPVALIPHYSGRGVNHFDAFMSSKIRQNILWAVTNDALTAEEISLEIGVPLPYMEDDLAALAEKQIVLRQGKRYLANVIVKTAAYTEECERAAEPLHEKIASSVADFLDGHLAEMREAGVNTASMHENTLRWQLATLVFRQIAFAPERTGAVTMPETAWGDEAFLSCEEARPDKPSHEIFWYSSVGDGRDTILFFDYIPKLCGDHHDFFGKEHRIGLYCALARGEIASPSDFDRDALEALAEEGYVRREKGGWSAACAVYTAEQAEKLTGKVAAFVDQEISPILEQLQKDAERILAEHTPKHLRAQVPGIASGNIFVNGVCIPAEHLIEKGILLTDWMPGELPGTFLVLGN
ncbi:MAG: sigma-70 family RNA polymerase sigma factor [Clostridia bacterium]|nr:sigma-70 family RNA polymerase sigma factor [Clostridia bacterium]